MNKQQMQQEALTRAVSSQAISNYPLIIEGFTAKGIPADDIKPRENVFTFNAWKALGRSVKRGEHGVKVVTFVPVEKKDPTTGEVVDRFRKPHTTTVFHVSQTVELAPVSAPSAKPSEPVPVVHPVVSEIVY